MIHIVKKEISAIRLSENGWWYHEDKPFENENVIQFFHKAVTKDKDGEYYLYNRFGDKEEQVYFQVDDTAYFVWNLKFDERQKRFIIVLNTGAQEILDVHSLKEDERGIMYCRVLDNDRARLDPRALGQLSEHVDMDDELIYIEKTGEKIILSKG